MTKKVTIFIALYLLLFGCKPLENTISLANTKPPVVRKDITFSYSSDQIRYGENNIKKSWANRNDVQVLNVKIINNSNQSIHGSQFTFYSNGKRLEIINNKLAARKLKSKKFPSAVYIIPGVIVAVVIYAGLKNLIEGPSDIDGDGFDDNIDKESGETGKNRAPLAGMNLIQKQLYVFNIAEKIVPPNGQISGMIAFHSSTKIDNLDIHVRKTDYEVIDKSTPINEFKKELH